MRVSVFGRGSIHVSPLGRYVGGGIGIILILLSLQFLAALVSYVYEAAASRRWRRKARGRQRWRAALELARHLCVNPG